MSTRNKTKGKGLLVVNAEKAVSFLFHLANHS